MKKFFLLVAALLFAAQPVLAQSTYNTPAGVRVQGVVTLTCDINGANCVPGSSSTTGAADSTVGQNSTTAGQMGTLVQCAATTAAPTYVTATTDPLSCTTGGALRTSTLAAGSQVDGIGASPGFAVDGAGAARPAAVVPYGFGGTNSDRFRTVQGADGTGLGTQAVGQAPSSAAGAATLVSLSATGTVENSRTVSGVHNLYGLRVHTGATAGWVICSDAAAAQADGATAGATFFTQVAANTTFSVRDVMAYRNYTTGITCLFSSTGPATVTKSTTVLFEIYYR
jgi:hypothetical protein